MDVDPFWTWSHRIGNKTLTACWLSGRRGCRCPRFGCLGLVWFGLVSLFSVILTSIGYLMLKLIAGGDKGIHIFPKGICPKVNIIAWLEFKLAYFETTVQHFSHYAMGTFQLQCLRSQMNFERVKLRVAWCTFGRQVSGLWKYVGVTKCLKFARLYGFKYSYIIAHTFIVSSNYYNPL